MRRLIARCILPVVAGASLSACALIPGIPEPNSMVLPGGVATGSDGYGVRATFANVENLVPNSRVMYHDAVIGTVTKIDLGKQWQAAVSMKLKKSVTLAKNVTFRIGQESLLGAEYVEVDDPVKNASTTPLQPGDVVQVDATGNYPETEDVLSAVSLLLNDGGLAQIKTITSELDTMIGSPDEQATTRDVIGRANVLLASLDQHKADILHLIHAINALSATLAQQRQVIAGGLSRIGPGLRALEQERGTLVRALTQLGHFSTTSARIIDRTGAQLAADLQNLQPVLGKLRSVADTLPDAVKAAVTWPFPFDGIPTVFRGDFANLFATFDLTLPQVAAAFIGGPADVSGDNPPATAFQSLDPLLGPLAGALSPKAGTAGSGKIAQGAKTWPPTPAPTSPTPAAPGPTAPTSSQSSAAPTAVPSTGKPSCGLLSSLLGGC